jgi:hypothetical protein
MPSLFRRARNALFADEEKMLTIKAGIAKGMYLPINRRVNIRPETGLAEIGIAPYVRDLTPDRSIAYDIGSHVGYYVLAFARLRAARIVAFEPDQALLAQLRATLAANKLEGRVEVVERFVSDHTKADHVSLDGLIEDQGYPVPDLIKIDIDGGEVSALEGATRLLKDRRPSLVIEVHSVELESSTLDILKASKYQRIDVVDSGPLISRLAPELRFPATHNRWLVAWDPSRVTTAVAVKRIPGMTVSERLA